MKAVTVPSSPIIYTSLFVLLYLEHKVCPLLVAVVNFLGHHSHGATGKSGPKINPAKCSEIQRGGHGFTDEPWCYLIFSPYLDHSEINRSFCLLPRWQDLSPASQLQLPDYCKPA